MIDYTIEERDGRFVAYSLVVKNGTLFENYLGESNTRLGAQSIIEKVKHFMATQK